ncbi:MAG: BCCT family transporter [Gemmatimonadota bacterium]|nr:BCCT family transporter [Gemmatimonadota bacterium]
MDWKKQLDFSPAVVFPALTVIGIFLGFGIFAPGSTGAAFDSIQSGIVANFGWLYVGSVAVFLAFSVYLLFSSVGSVRLGPDDSEPEFSYPSWFAMLFSAGMGIGLVFFSVAEPIYHLTDPPIEEAGTTAAADGRHAAHVLPLGTARLGNLHRRGPVARVFFLPQRASPLDPLGVLPGAR